MMKNGQTYFKILVVRKWRKRKPESEPLNWKWTVIQI